MRTGRVQDTEDGLSEFPHVIVNQARIHDYLLDSMRRSPTRLELDYGLEFVGLTVDEGPTIPSPSRCGAPMPHATPRRSVRAKYVVGCDGARSAGARVDRARAAR